MSNDRRVRLVLASGLRREATEALADRFAGPSTAVVHHDLREVADGVVRRRLRVGARDTTVVLDLAHGCVSCTLREDLLPLVRKLIATPAVERIVLHLDPMVEPEPVCWALHHALVGEHTITDLADIEAVVTVLDERTWLDDATGDVQLAEHVPGVPSEDDRTLAQVAVGQVEFADAVVLDGRADAWLGARTAAVLDRLTPGAPRAYLDTLEQPELGLDALLAAVPENARRGEVTDAHGPLLRGQPPLDADCGVTLTVFRDRRPFHPERLHAAIDVLLDGVVRSRGRVWVASQPDVALWLESSGGGLRVGHAGVWLAAVDDESWDRADADRRAKAAFDWDPRFGDRVQELVVIAHRADPEDIVAALRSALLTDAEMADEDAWPHYPDPFGAWHADPCAETADLGVPTTRKEES
ncbi:ribosome hibernation factor-recruiting GTPase MRF [Actinokineospora iranica]|uniref:GTPase, G3E family n=1 Tax=Actinokineospora iranica TaxID=1271860 RepID=A0A1G6TPQ9_9PSEU|nr:GTP-binding protein [Actinokineospora iranica]SDD30357.1 GTPase, G3E family [Actinokineospora iranica]